MSTWTNNRRKELGSFNTHVQDLYGSSIGQVQINQLVQMTHSTRLMSGEVLKMVKVYALTYSKGETVSFVEFNSNE